MKRTREHEEEELRKDHATAVAKASAWRIRAIVAHGEGRKADAARCEDKARDWSSRAREIERRLTDEGQLETPRRPA